MSTLHFGTSASSLADLSANQYGLSVEGDRLTWMAAPQLSFTDTPGRDGAHIYGSRYAGRRFSIPIRVEGDDADDLRNKLDAIAYKLRPGQGNGYWKLDAVPDRLAFGRIGAAVEFQTFGARLARGVLQIVCPDAFLHSTTETVQTVTVSGSPQAFNVTASGVAPGTAPASPVWVVKNTSGGASGALTLANSTTGESVSTSAGIANGHWLRFDAVRKIIERSTDSGGSWASFMAYRGSARNIPGLNPQVQNACTLTGLTGGEITITYRARFL